MPSANGLGLVAGDFNVVDRASREIEKQAKNLAEVKTWMGDNPEGEHEDRRAVFRLAMNS